jgi:hypothetical protein
MISGAPDSRSQGYTVHPDLGDAALGRLREGLRRRGLRLMLEFVPNHTSLDYPRVEEHPEYHVAGTEADLAWPPRNYTWVKRTRSDLLVAYGRDPYTSRDGRARCRTSSNPLLADGDARGAGAGPGLCFMAEVY